MKSLKQIRNILQRKTLINTDKGLRHGYPATATMLTGQNTLEKTLGDLTDRRRISRTVENSREAMEIDPTTWSSIISMAMTANNEYTITGDENANPDAIQHIQEKVKTSQWDLTGLMTETLIKGMVDSKCFIRTWPNQENPSTLDVDMLAYDTNNYDFIELIDHTTGELLGYKQKATTYPVPGDWENTSFDSLKTRNPEETETNFTPDEVIHPKFLERDRTADSLVFKVLDYVDIKRELENMIPAAVRRASLSLGVRIGGPDVDLNITSTTEAQATVDEAADTFKEKEKKDVISHFYGVEPYMIGNGNMPDFIGIFDYLKQEIRQALLTPDSRFQSASSNRAVAREQLSGSMGQVTVISYLQSWLRKYFEDQLFTRELLLAGYGSEVGKIHISFDPLEEDDELQMAQIAEKLEASYPSLTGDERNLRIATYFPDYSMEYTKAGITPAEAAPPPTPVPEDLVSETDKGVIQNTLTWPVHVENARQILIKEGVLSG